MGFKYMSRSLPVLATALASAAVLACSASREAAGNHPGAATSTTDPAAPAFSIREECQRALPTTQIGSFPAHVSSV